MAEEAVKKIDRRGRISYVEPNNVIINDNLIRSDSLVKNPLEDYNILVDLYVEMVDRFRCGVENSSSESGEINGIEGKKFIHFFGGTNGNLSTNYTNISLSDTIHGDQREMIGVENISISYDSWFIPTVNITFTDLRGASVMIPQEAGMLATLRQEREIYEHDKEEAEKNGYTHVIRDPRDLTSLGTNEFSGSFFKSLFAFPPPVFYLSVKGFYGNPVSYKLALKTVSLELDSNSGNFKINTQFIGYLYGLFADLPAVYCAVAPYMKYNNNGGTSEESNWTNEDFRFPPLNGETDGSPMLMFSDFNERITQITDGGLSDFYESDIVEELAELEVISATFDNLISKFPCRASNGFETKKLEDNSYVYYKVVINETAKKQTETDLNSNFEAYNKILDGLKLLKEKRDDFNIAKKFVGETKGTNGKFDVKPKYTLKIVGDTETSSGSAKLSNYPDFLCYKTGLKNDTIYLYEYYCKVDVITELKKARENFVEILRSKEEEVSKARNENIKEKYGFVPCIEHMYYMIFSHMNMFMDIFFNCLSDINNQLINKQRTFSKLGLSSLDVDYNTENESDNKLEEQQVPPFPLIFKDKFDNGRSKRVEIWPPEYDASLENLPEVQLTYALLNASREFNTVIEAQYAARQQQEDDESVGNEENEDTGESVDYDLLGVYSPAPRYLYFPIHQGDMTIGFYNPYSFIGADDNYNSDKSKFIDSILTTFLTRYSYFYNQSNIEASLLMSKKVGVVEAYNLCNGISNVTTLKNMFLGDSGLSNAKDNISNYMGKRNLKVFSGHKMFKDGNYNLITYNGKKVYPLRYFDENSVNEYLTKRKKGIYDDECYFVDDDKTYSKSSGSSSRKYYIFHGYDLINHLKTYTGIKSSDNEVLNDEGILDLSSLFDNDDVYSDSNGINNNSLYEIGILRFKHTLKTSDLTSKKIIENMTNGVKYTTEQYGLSSEFSKFVYNHGIHSSEHGLIFFTKIYNVQTDVKSKAYLFIMSLLTQSHANTLYYNSLLTNTTISHNGYRFSVDILTEGAFLWRYHIMSAGGADPIIGNTASTKPTSKQYYKCNIVANITPYCGLIIDPDNIGYFTVKDSDIEQIDKKSERGKYCEQAFINFANGSLFKQIMDIFELKKLANDKIYPFSTSNFNTNGSKINISSNNGLYYSNTGSKNDTKIEVTVFKDSEFACIKGALINYDSDAWKTADNILLELLTDVNLCIDLSIPLTDSGEKVDFTSSVNTAFSYFYKTINYLINSDNGKSDTVGGDNSEGRTSSEDTEKTISKTDTTKSKDIRLATYLVLKNLYDRWICGTKREDWNIKNNENVYSKFVYIDSFYTEIGSRLMVNLAKMRSRIEDICVNSNGEHISNKSVYELLSNIANDNKCMVFALPHMFGLETKDDFENVFDVKSYKDCASSLSEKTSFVVMYSQDSSHHLASDDEDNLNDGFDLADSLGNIYDIMPGSLVEETTDGLGKIRYIPAFGVTYGKGNQSYFKNITLTTKEPSVSEYTIQSMMNIASLGGEGQSQANGYGQDLYRTFANYSYKTDVTMMGDAMITPLMYFQLNNIPLWHGAYIVTSVKHEIGPGRMETSFSGYRLSKYTYDFVDPCIIELESTIKTQYSTDSLANGSFGSYVSTRTYHMCSGFTYADFERSSKAKSLKIDNTLPDALKNRVAELVETILAPMKGCCGGFQITSGYRCPALNSSIGIASKTSAHMAGLAADLSPVGQSYEEFKRKVIAFLKSGVKYDQYIEEHSGDSKWIHIGVRNMSGAQRKQNLLYQNDKYTSITI